LPNGFAAKAAPTLKLQICGSRTKFNDSRHRRRLQPFPVGYCRREHHWPCISRHLWFHSHQTAALLALLFTTAGGMEFHDVNPNKVWKAF